ncbi:peptidoglycan editing factor PgeF [Geopsychrobacter electrodiphilus]|uniref:peptidoglycan editing factor PgeF n=1 Tax=Geopsychrobacter electrodiphilus TaxID=225196 RepID=UPI00037B38BD|nr:peptidoglycan editing factor PgeF [Geopsychrobacter electrodiphilus]
MKMTRADKISYLEPDWASPDMALSAGFSTRHGGVSRAPYNSLNLGFGTDDQPAHVEGNRANFCRAFNLQPHQLLTIKQVHGTSLLLIDEENLDLSHFLSVEADGIVTNQRGFMLGVLVADCVPLLLHHPGKGVVAAVHVGWRGAANGIIAQAIDSMNTHFHCAPEEILAAVGPGIGAHRFEVDRPVREAFRGGSGFWDLISKEVSLGHWQVDLGLSSRLQLESCGILSEHIDVAQECTCCHQELFFSYRRDKGETGRQLGFIQLK